MEEGAEVAAEEREQREKKMTCRPGGKMVF